MEKIEKKRILVGKIEKLFKLDGEVKVLPLTYSRERFLDFKKLYLDEEEDIFLTVKNVKIYNNGIVIKFKEFENIDIARKYLNFYLYINIDEIKDLDSDSIYFFELNDYYLSDGLKELGTIKDIYEDGTSHYITFDYDKKEYIVPFNKDFIKKIDKKKKVIFINHFNSLIGNEIE